MYYFLLGSFIYSFLLSMLTKRYRLLSEILGIMLLTIITLMIGLRFDVGIDYPTYQLDFDMYYNNFSYEIIYTVLRYSIKVLFDKFYYLTFLMILISNIFIYLGLKKREIKGQFLILSLMIYSSSTAIIFMNIMRQGVAIAIFFYASTFIKERNFKKYLLYMVIGAGFHLSILFLIPLYFFQNIKLGKMNFFISILLSYFLVYTQLINVFINFVASKISFYSKYYNHEYILNTEVDLLSFGVLINVIYFCFLLNFKDENRYTSSTLDISYYQIGLLLDIMSIATFMVGRIEGYFSIFGIVAIPKIIMSVNNKMVRMLLVILTILISIILFSQTLLVNPESLNLEYKSIFLRQ